MREMVKSIY